MADRLLGIETEYALSAVGTDGDPVDRMSVLRRMLELAEDRFPTLSDGTGRGLFLPNGARFYIDAPDHPEFATPECTDPRDVVRYQRAGDRLLSELAAAAAASMSEVASVYLLRCNVDYSGQETTWGQHENYMHTCDPRLLPEQIVPHLVSRIVYTGAGGFNNLCGGELQFTLSPRVWHLIKAVSSQSQGERGIFHTKQEPLSGGGYHRLHVLAGETLASDTAAWLKVATTALVVAMVDGGLRPGDAVQLESPLRTMRLFASDPTCRAVSAVGEGRRLSAVEIQRHYLQVAEDHVDASFMPRWAAEACRRWHEVLDLLAEAPGSVATILDWAMKRTLYERHALRRGTTWKSLKRWNRLMRAYANGEPPAYAPDASDLADTAHAPGLADGTSEEETADLFERFGSARRRAATVATRRSRLHLGRGGPSQDALRAFRELRQELFELDARFAQLDGGGVFGALERAGVLTHALPGIDGIDRAMEHPPAVGRAAVRAAYVRQLAPSDRSNLFCDWWGIWDSAGRRSVDLRDPFATAAKWGAWLAPGSRLHPPVDVDHGDGTSTYGTEVRAQALENRGECAAAEPLRRRSLAEVERRRGSDSTDTALACNQLAVLLRTMGRPAEAEPLSRRALRIDEAALSAGSPTIPHRLNNVAVLLVMQGELAEAKEHLARGWQLKSDRHDITSARILWTRLAAALLGAESSGVFVGLLRSLLAGPQLQLHGNVIARWAVEPILDFIRPSLSDRDAELLGMLAEILNDRSRLGRLETCAAWLEQPALPLDTPWPAESGHLAEELREDLNLREASSCRGL